MSSALSYSKYSRQALVITGLVVHPCFWGATLCGSIYLLGAATEIVVAFTYGAILAMTILVRNIVVMHRHNWYRSEYVVGPETICVGRDEQSGAWMSWDCLKEIRGRVKPPKTLFGLVFMLARDSVLLGRDLVLEFEGQNEIVIPRVGLSMENNPILLGLVEVSGHETPLSHVLSNWSRWRRAEISRQSDPARYTVFRRPMWILLAALPGAIICFVGETFYRLGEFGNLERFGWYAVGVFVSSVAAFFMLVISRRAVR